MSLFLCFVLSSVRR